MSTIQNKEPIHSIEETARKIILWQQASGILIILLVNIAVTIYLFKYISESLIVAVILWFFSAIMIFLMALKIYISSKQVSQYATASDPVTVDEKEILKLVVCGILRTDMHVRSSAFFGSGQIQSPENCLLFTDKALYVIYLQIGRGDQVSANIDFGIAEFILANQELKTNLHSKLDNMTLSDVINGCSFKRRIEINNIQQFTINDITNSVEFTFKNNTFKYGIRNKEDYITLKTYLLDSYHEKTIMKTSLI